MNALLLKIVEGSHSLFWGDGARTKNFKILIADVREIGRMAVGLATGSTKR